MRLPRTPRALAVAVIAGTVVLAPASAAFANSPVTPAKAETTADASAQAKTKAKYYIHLSGGDTVALDPSGLTAEIGANSPVGRLSVTRPGPVKSGYSGWTYRLFVPASKPDLNPPHVVATYQGKLMQKIYFTPDGKKPVPVAPMNAMTPTGAVKAGAESLPVEGRSNTGARNSDAILLASGGGAAVAAGLGFGAMRRRQENN
ncbi:hypothetical protein [Streptomyces sp. NBC_01304]|uniref:hypothetical protein n=1 Tax=Streptomyces sp. NBC_01304 TaxID=2903818 RepID=UPI002E0D26C2|nr:hypothetical protein OG430_27000 [Streptomyces sp. NBC_01304]